MAEKHTGMTPARDERRVATPRTTDWGNPVRVLQRMADQMDHVFEDFGFGPLSSRSLWRMSGMQAWAPDVDVFQKNNELTIRADLPGLRREDVNVEITDDSVHIQGERRREHAEEREGYYRTERSYGSFNRVIPLPEGAITEQAKATFKDGVLEITMPAPPESKGRRLEINEGTKK